MVEAGDYDRGSYDTTHETSHHIAVRQSEQHAYAHHPLVSPAAVVVVVWPSPSPLSSPVVV